MKNSGFTRRDSLKWLGTGAATAARVSVAAPTSAAVAGRIRRMRWWHDAKFGMFIHFGLFAVNAKDVWNYESEGWTMAEYAPLVSRFNPQRGCCREWARLARKAGQKYMVLTAKNHDGFCLWDTRTTKFSAPNSACRRDVLAEYVEAARAEGIRVGFYFSIFDWHHPDGERCADDEAARKRMVAFTHEQIRELLTNYGKIDILWYDGARPNLGPQGWESERMNRMVFDLQPDIIVNNRNGLEGDFSTPEQKIVAEKDGRAWESCMTLNQSWGYQAADVEWKTPRELLRNLALCVRDNGNYLVSIGPRPDGSVQQEAIDLLTNIGGWMNRNGQSIYGCQRSQVTRHQYAGITSKGNTLFLHVHAWPGTEIRIGAVVTKAVSARFLATGKSIPFEQNVDFIRIAPVPEKEPDPPMTVIAIEFESEPVQDMVHARRTKKRPDVA